MTTLYEFNSPPIKAAAFTFHVALVSQADTDIFKTSPTLAAGDITVSKDGGNFANITTLPTQIQSTGVLPVALSASEMDANIVTVKFVDAAGAEWQDALVTIRTVSTGTVASVDEVWDELLVGHVIAGSAGAILSSAGSSTDPLLNSVPGTYNAGTAGAALGRIGSGQISTTSIVAQNGDVETYRGDSYANADARRIDWTDTSANWPTLTAATILVVIGGDVSFAGSVIVATGAGKKVGLELTSAQSATIPQGKLDFVVIATLASGNQVTLLEGTWTSKRRLAVGS
jgi:hypothetical protein